VLIFTPLVALTILFGVAPKPVLDMSAASVTQLLDNYKHAMASVDAPAKDVMTGSAAIKMERAEMIPVSAAQ
jgi:hypothetical protein